MNLRQQIIADRTEALATPLNIKADEAFMRLGWSLVTAKSIHSFDPTDVVGGGQEADHGGGRGEGGEAREGEAGGGLAQVADRWLS